MFWQHWILLEKEKILLKKIKSYEKIPYAFGELNGGFLAYNKSTKDNVLNKWPSIFYKYMVETKGGINLL